MVVDQVFDFTREFLRPAGWRGKTPDPADLDGSLIFPRDRTAISFDDTEIAYSVYGKSGPWIVLVPGFVCPDNFWKYLVPELEDDYRLVVYDLRGLGMSGTPRAPGWRARNLKPEDFAIESQVRDIEAILDKEGVDETVLIGHSMGGQIQLEAYRWFPERISAEIMVTAPFESPLRTFYGRDFTLVFHAVRRLFEVMPRSSVLVWRSLLLANPSLTHELAKLTRALGPDAKLDDMRSYYRHMAYLDPIVILTMAESMRTHSAADLLPEIAVPTLIVSGTQDTFTPPSVAKRKHDEIPDSEHVVIERAGHGAIIEKPTEVNAAIRDFLTRHLPRT